jgi:hypothetical protein
VVLQRVVVAGAPNDEEAHTGLMRLYDSPEDRRKPSPGTVGSGSRSPEHSARSAVVSRYRGSPQGRIEEGKVVGNWGNRDLLGMLQQPGVLSAPAGTVDHPGDLGPNRRQRTRAGNSLQVSTWLRQVCGPIDRHVPVRRLCWSYLWDRVALASVEAPSLRSTSLTRPVTSILSAPPWDR